jgi:hypothetical protein
METLFASFLFVVYFTFASWLIASPKVEVQIVVINSQTDRADIQTDADPQTDHADIQTDADPQTDHADIQTDADPQTDRADIQTDADLQTDRADIQTDADLQTDRADIQTDADLQTDRADIQTDADPQTDCADLQTIVSALRLYKLHKHSVVKISDLPLSLSIPTTIKRYKLRGEEVIRLIGL